MSSQCFCDEADAQEAVVTLRLVVWRRGVRTWALSFVNGGGETRDALGVVLLRSQSDAAIGLREVGLCWMEPIKTSDSQCAVVQL